MASVSVVPASGIRDPSGNVVGVDSLPSGMNDMKIRDEKVNYATSFILVSPIFVILYKLILILKSVFIFVFLLQEMEATIVDGNGTEAGHIIVTTIGGKNGQPKQVTF